VVTADARGRRPPICDELLKEFLTLRIIAVAPYENYAVCYWASLDIHAEDIESSEDGFLGAVKKAAQISSCGSQVN
jgi:hypothetical protein